MSDSTPAVVQDARPTSLHTSRSFTRMAPPPTTTSHRKRASTVQTASVSATTTDQTERPTLDTGASDVFETHEDGSEQPMAKDDQLNQVVGTMEDLPIEIRSLTGRFLDGLLAKVHPAPLSADQLSDMFQDFYEKAAQQIATHIASLASRIARADAAPTSRLPFKGRARAGSGARADSPASASGGEMLTPSEVADRRRARRMLELKRVSMEETVERCVCERVYERIWKHRSTDDEARDEKLRSRTAALAVVGIGLKELHMDADLTTTQVRRTAEQNESDISASLTPARMSLQLMNDEEYPLGKLQHLTAAHKAIVDTLSEHFPSTSSADEILPTLIYTLITSPPDALSVVSNLSFIQRFRGATRIDGEAAYCLVNLEAAISFLETVDLSSLRADELPEGPPKTPSQPHTPVSEDVEPLAQRSPRPDTSPTTTNISEQVATGTFVKPMPPEESTSLAARPALHQRSLSAMVQAQASKIEAGRENILNTADRVYESINGTLENSFKFVFGRFKDQIGADAAPLPKTLDDARRLMNPSMSEAEGEDDDVSQLSGHSSPGDVSRWALASDNKMLDLVSGRRQLRDRSVDSSRSGSSAKRVAFAAASTSSQSVGRPLPPADPLRDATSFITSINPLNRFAVPSFPRFGRAPSGSTPTEPTVKAVTNIISVPEVTPTSARSVDDMEKTKEHGAVAETDLNAIEALATLRKIKPPRKRFLEVGSAAELRIGDVEELLQEYRRLAKAIGEALAK